MKLARLVTACILVLLIAACARDTGDPATSAGGWTRAPELSYLSDFPVDTHLTERQAQTASLHHLAETLTTLPPGVTLTPKRQLWDPVYHQYIDTRPAYSGSCVLDARAANPPYKYMITYDIHGVPGNKPEALEQIRTAWEQLHWKAGYQDGWKVVTKKTTVAWGRTPDHYTFVAQETLDGRRLISVTSPCFPHTGLGHTEPLPEVITRSR